MAGNRNKHLKRVTTGDPLWGFREDWVPFVFCDYVLEKNQDGELLVRFGYLSVRINDLAADVLARCSGSASFGAIVDAISRDRSLPREQAEQEVNRELINLRKKDIVRINGLDQVDQTVKMENLKILCDGNPFLAETGQLLTADQCVELASLLDGLAKPAGVYRNQQRVQSKVREAEHVQLKIDNPSEPLQALLEAYEACTGLKRDYLDGVELIRYSPGGFYKPHFDAFETLNPGHPSTSDPQHGQRIFTTVVYLTDGFEGGHTSFPRMRRSLRPAVGEGVMFSNCFRGDIKQNPLSIHAGETVTAGQKVIATLWHRNIIKWEAPTDADD